MSTEDTPHDGLDYWAWTIIANARDWHLTDPQAAEWREAAVRWRDAFHATLEAPL